MKFLHFFLFLGGIFSFTALADDNISKSPTENTKKEPASPLVTIEGAWARVTKKGNVAVYMTLKTPPDQKDVLVGGKCEAADRIELHTHTHERGIMRMRPVEKMEVAGEKNLKPGGDHVMLMGLNKDLKVGQTINVTLHFEKTGDVAVSVPVKPVGGYRAHAEHKPH